MMADNDTLLPGDEIIDWDGDVARLVARELDVLWKVELVEVRNKLTKLQLGGVYNVVFAWEPGEDRLTQIRGWRRPNAKS
jgi:hypothetical protein